MPMPPPTAYPSHIRSWSCCNTSRSAPRAAAGLGTPVTPCRTLSLVSGPLLPCRALCLPSRVPLPSFFVSRALRLPCLFPKKPPPGPPKDPAFLSWATSPRGPLTGWQRHSPKSGTEDAPFLTGCSASRTARLCSRSQPSRVLRGRRSSRAYCGRPKKRDPLTSASPCEFAVSEGS